MILIRHEYCPYISLVESYFDTIIWLKFDKKKIVTIVKIFILHLRIFHLTIQPFMDNEHEVDLFTELEKQY